MDSVIWLISQGVECVDVNAATVSMGPTTAISEAAKIGRWDIVRLLEDCGARYNSSQEISTRAITNETPTTTPQPPKKRPFEEVVVERTWFDRNKRKRYSEVAVSVTEEHMEDEENMCVVCMERPSKTAMVPCGHASFCEECAKRLQSTVGKCAICRANIQTVVNIYFS